MNTDKFTIRDFFVFFLSGISVFLCYCFVEFDYILNWWKTVDNNDTKAFIKENSTAIGLLSIPVFYFIGHLVHGIDDLFNHYSKRIKKQINFIKSNWFTRWLNKICFKNRINGYLEMNNEDVEAFWQKCAYIQVYSNFQSIDYFYVMNELFKGLTITCFAFCLYAFIKIKFIQGGFMIFFTIIFWERAHYFVKRFLFAVPKMVIAIQEQNKKKHLTIPVSVLFQPEFCTAILLIENEYIDLNAKRTEAKGLGLYEKEEFHVTIIGTEIGEKILKKLDNLEERKKLNALEELKSICDNFQWEVRALNEYFYIKKFYNKNKELELPKNQIEKREAIIQIVKINNFATFFKKINQLFDTNFETPMPHVTLFASSNIEDKRLRGIGIYSKKQFLKLAPEKI